MGCPVADQCRTTGFDPLTIELMHVVSISSSPFTSSDLLSEMASMDSLLLTYATVHQHNTGCGNLLAFSAPNQYWDSGCFLLRIEATWALVIKSLKGILPSRIVASIQVMKPKVHGELA